MNLQVTAVEAMKIVQMNRSTSMTEDTDSFLFTSQTDNSIFMTDDVDNSLSTSVLSLKAKQFCKTAAEL